MGKTLIVYYTVNGKARQAFEASRRPGEVDVLELRERYDRSAFEAATIGVCQAMAGRASKIDPPQVNLKEYDCIVVATPVWGGQPAPAVNAFLHQVDFMGCRVCTVLVTRIGKGRDCGNVMRRRIASAGGDCRDVATITLKDLALKPCDAYAIALPKLGLA